MQSKPRLPHIMKNACREPLVWANTRQAALSQLEAFIPSAARYAQARNHVLLDHNNVSRLSPAIRHRLLLESECAAAPLREYPARSVEKFTQEIYWRRYWKAWLSLRPTVWTDYRKQLSAMQSDPIFAAQRAHAARCLAGDSAIAIMNHFARELVESGYLHNHARLWFAGWWIHIEQLPWQLGADFFFRHLLDADPASNTLSWRWVAGLHTPGKFYLPRRHNLEKYLSPNVLASHNNGLNLLENPQPLVPCTLTSATITRPTLPPSPPIKAGRLGIWLHEEDLLVEKGPLATVHPCALLATADSTSRNHFQYPKHKCAWLRTALHDAAQRASSAFGITPDIETDLSITEAILLWAKTQQLTQIAAMRPEIGPLNDQVHTLQSALDQVGIALIFFDRPEDLALRPLATGGFFSFWEKIQKSGLCPSTPEAS